MTSITYRESRIIFHLTEILSRTLIALAISTFGLGIYALASRLILRRANKKLLGLEAARPGLPTISYFTTPSCVSCRTVQRPAIESLAATYGSALQVINIDAQAQPEIADYWGVLSVPTTFIFDQNGRPRFMNAGVANAEKLERQLREAGLEISSNGVWGYGSMELDTPTPPHSHT